MKHLFLTISLLLVSLCAVAQDGGQSATKFERNHQAIADFIEKYRNVDNISIIEIGSTMTKMMAVKLFEAGNDESAKLMRSIESIEIVAENSQGKSHITGEMFELPDKCQNFELITSIDKSGERTKFYFAEHPRSKNREFLMLMRSFDQRIVLYITGSFSISDISALSSLSEGINKGGN